MKALAVLGKESAVISSPAQAVWVKDGMGRNVIQWLPEVVGKPEGAPSIVLAVDDGKARVYLTKEEATDLAITLAELCDTL